MRKQAKSLKSTVMLLKPNFFMKISRDDKKKRVYFRKISRNYLEQARRSVLDEIRAEQAALKKSLRREFQRRRALNNERRSEERIIRRYISQLQDIKESKKRIEDYYAQKRINTARSVYTSLRTEVLQSKLYLKCLLEFYGIYIV